MGDKENKENEKIILPKDIQISMLEFFLRTSIPRKKKQMQNLLSEKEKG